MALVANATAEDVQHCAELRNEEWEVIQVSKVRSPPLSTYEITNI
jgi:hypothetical protein